MAACIVTCARKDCAKSFKLKKRKVLSVQYNAMSERGLANSRFFVTMICKYCGKQLVNVLRVKDMYKLGYSNGELRVVLSGGTLVGRR